MFVRCDNVAAPGCIFGNLGGHFKRLGGLFGHLRDLLLPRHGKVARRPFVVPYFGGSEGHLALFLGEAGDVLTDSSVGGGPIHASVVILFLSIA